MLSRLVLGVKNLESEKGPVTIQDFRDLALKDQGANMLRMAREAVALVTERRASDREEALGNSAPSRLIISDGAASQA